MTTTVEPQAQAARAGNGTIIASYDRVASEPAYGSVPRVFMKPVSGGTRSRPVRTH
jgi:hypothetical protein